jgi:chromosome segregation ATPase
MQLQNEKSQLMAENQKLADQLGKAEQELGQLRAGQGQLAARAAAAETRAARSETGAAARLESAEARLNEIAARYRELAETLRQVEVDRASLQQQVQRDSASLEACAANNVELAGIANEALTRYVKKGCFGAMAQAEPFTGIQRARIENAVADSRARVEALKVESPPRESTTEENNVKQ